MESLKLGTKKPIALITAFILLFSTVTVLINILPVQADVGYGTFGNTDIGSSSGTMSSTWSCKFTSPDVEDMEIVSLSAYMQPWGTPINFGVYSSDGSTQLGVTSNATQAENGPKWYTRAFSSPIAISANTDYFLSVCTDSDGSDIWYSAGANVWWVDGENTNLPATLNHDITTGTRAQSIYATYQYEEEGDINAPTYANLSSTSLIAGGTTKLNVTVTDETDLATTGGYILQTNTTGTVANSTWAAFTSNPQTVSSSVVLNSVVGNKVQWKYYFNDTAGNWNSTSLSTITLLNSTATAIWIADGDYGGTFEDAKENILSANLTGLIDDLVINKIHYALIFIGYWNVSTQTSPYITNPYLVLTRDEAFYENVCSEMIEAGIVPIAWGEDGGAQGFGLGTPNLSSTYRDAYFTEIERWMDMGFSGYSENIETSWNQTTRQDWLDYHNNQTVFLHNLGKLSMPAVQFDLYQNINNYLYVDFIISTFYGSDASLFEDDEGDYFFQENFGIYDGHNTPPASPVMLGIKAYENAHGLGWQLAEAKRCIETYNPTNFAGFAFWVYEYVATDYPQDWVEWQAFWDSGESDIISPVFGEISSDTTLANQAASITCTIGDDVAVSGFIASWNNSGSWVNGTWTAGGSGLLEGTLNRNVGIVVSVIFYANDSSGNWASSTVYSIVTNEFMQYQGITVIIGCKINGVTIADGTKINGIG